MKHTNDNPFDLNDDNAYQRWREHKLADYPESIGDLVVELHDPRMPSKAERDAILRLCNQTNMAIWSGLSGMDSDKDIIRTLGLEFGLQRLDDHLCTDEDAISSLTVQQDSLRKGYIPYTDRPIAWHTDGYYNPMEYQIRGMLLHCVQPAYEGGVNDLLDHEIAYMLIRDENPDYIQALMHPQAMTIPANIVDGHELRPVRTGPVFSLMQGHLHMRYTDRTRSIEWRNDPLTQEAVDALKRIIKTPSQWHYKGKLEAGQGLICNNVLHTRSGFTDQGPKRLIYRARYFDRITSS